MQKNGTLSANSAAAHHISPSLNPCFRRIRVQLSILAFEVQHLGQATARSWGFELGGSEGRLGRPQATTSPEAFPGPDLAFQRCEFLLHRRRTESQMRVLNHRNVCPRSALPPSMNPLGGLVAARRSERGGGSLGETLPGRLSPNGQSRPFLRGSSGKAKTVKTSDNCG